ncbi:hypothetical protein N1851_026142 [Merluccius polli]|uniref:Uncharacterized protein n=1 Tax=Merluccius polli TaxID=89951 RepID=A0AA47MCB8_MERPO|nr:hypothetical protein N1851_026142 [Merluccius polli]
MGRNQRVQLDVVVGWMILPVGSVEILQAEQMFLQSSLLVLLAAHLDVLPAPWIPAGLYGVLPPDVGPVFGPSRWLFLDSLVALGPGAQSSGTCPPTRVQSTMDEETEEGGPPSKTTLSGDHGRHSRAKR